MENVRLTQAPAVALGLPDTTEEIDPGDTGQPAGDTGAATDAKAKGEASQPTQPRNGAIPAWLNDDGSIKDWTLLPGYQEHINAETSTALHKQQQRMQRDIQAAQERANAEAQRAKELEDAQREQERIDELLEISETSTDPLERARAEQELVEINRAQRMLQRVESKLKPTLAQQAVTSVLTDLDGQLRKAYKLLSDQFPEEVLSALDHGQYQDMTEWFVNGVEAITPAIVAKERAKWNKEVLEPAVAAARSDERARMRGFMPNPDLTEPGGEGGGGEGGVYRTEADVHNALADDLITPGQARHILATQFGRKFGGRR